MEGIPEVSLKQIREDRDYLKEQGYNVMFLTKDSISKSRFRWVLLECCNESTYKELFLVGRDNEERE